MGVREGMERIKKDTTTPRGTQSTTCSVPAELPEFPNAISRSLVEDNAGI